tara:strand:- start:2304 stop:2831 length:528 start_codon:yes stop_codon:yes gene_type:complete
VVLIKNIKIKDKDSISQVVNHLSFKKHALVDKGFSTYNVPHLEQTKVFQPIIDTFLKLAGSDYKLLDIWCNVYKKGGYVKLHQHHDPVGPLKDIPQKSGVYYFKKPEDSGNLLLEGFSLQTKEDDFVIFNSKTMHGSEKNISNADRIIFSINLGYKVGKEWSNNLNKYKLVYTLF